MIVIVCDAPFIALTWLSHFTRWIDLTGMVTSWLHLSQVGLSLSVFLTFQLCLETFPSGISDVLSLNNIRRKEIRTKKFEVRNDPLSRELMELVNRDVLLSEVQPCITCSFVEKRDHDSLNFVENSKAKFPWIACRERRLFFKTTHNSTQTLRAQYDYIGWPCRYPLLSLFT